MNRNLILVVDDDSSIRRVMKMQLEEAGYEVALAADGGQARAIIDQRKPKLVITDLRMPASGGLDLLRYVREDSHETTVMIITAFGTVETAVEAMKAGAYDYITKPLDYDAMVLAVHRAMERQNLLDEVRNLRSALDQRYGFENIVGRSKVLLRVLEMASRVAQRDSTVLIRGETGTGKELLARAIHHSSRRASRPFVTINCGAIPKELLESELFGYTRGAFSGAYAAKPGRIEMADGGTLFLDEVGELPLDMQVKLLRLLQHGEVDKIGSTSTQVVDVRVIAATHRNLQAMIEDGAFREDLYYRLAVVPLELPPLRERREDIPELVQHLFRRVKERHDVASLRLSPRAAGRFASYRWPGNIRELENVIERMVVLASGDEITEADLPPELQAPAPAQGSFLIEMPEHGISLEAVERELLVRALEKFNGNQTQAARYLDISRRTLIYRMDKHGLRSAADGE
ncbi:MAG: sigma-54-dependent Fis family transcriptional regulator [Bryobacterales bacterium]|nr:sigma-54-dependent Fis family transcriptional regulator [Bryobacterales bacterium]